MCVCIQEESRDVREKKPSFLFAMCIDVRLANVCKKLILAAYDVAGPGINPIFC